MKNGTLCRISSLGNGKDSSSASFGDFVADSDGERLIASVSLRLNGMLCCGPSLFRLTISDGATGVSYRYTAYSSDGFE